MAKQPKKHSKKKGLVLATLVAAAALAAAAFMYLKKRGVKPGEAAKRFGSRAKTAGAILKGESKAAYREVNQAVVAELVKANYTPSRRDVFNAIKEVMAVLKKRGRLTTAQYQVLGNQLKADWQTIRSQVKREL